MRHHFGRIVFVLMGLLLSLAAAPALTETKMRPATTTASRPATTATSRPAASKPASLPTSQTAVRPASRPSAEARRRILTLTHSSIELLKAKKYAEAEKVLEQVLALDPQNPTNLYNMACLQALLHHDEPAMLYLVRAAAAGFTDFVHIEKDVDLEPLRKRSDYKLFISKKDDYQRRAAEMVVMALRKQFGEHYLYEVDAENRMIFASNTDAATIAALKKHLAAQAQSQRRQLFEHKPDQYITVVVPSKEDFRKVVKMPSVQGFYNHDMHVLFVGSLGFVTTHEFTHALHFADVEPLGQEHPIWLVEGLAVMFEHSSFEGDDLIPHDSFRLNLAQRAAKAGALIPLARLLTMSQEQFVSPSRVQVAYAEAGNFMFYLYDKKLLRRFYDAYKFTYDKDRSGKQALERVTGMTLDALEKSFKAWLQTRKPPTIVAGPNGAYLGVRFEDQVDGVRVLEVVPAGPCAVAGMKPGDVIIGLDDIDVRDQMSFRSLFLEHKPGDEVVIKVRRDKDYLDLTVKLASRGSVTSSAPAPPSRRRP